MVRKLFLALLMAMALAGCWDLEELTKRTVVLAIGLDEAPTGRVRVSLQIPVVEELLIVPSGAAVSTKPFSIISAEGKSAFAAVPGLQSKTQMDLFLGHVKIIMINTAVAKKGLRDVVEFVSRHPTLPPQALLVLTDWQAREVLDQTLMDKRIPAYSMVTFFHGSAKKDRVFPQRAWKFNQIIASKTQDAYIPLMDYLPDEKRLLINGLGVFDRDRLVGRLSGEETRMFGLLAGKISNGYLSVPVKRHGRLAFRKVNARAKTKLWRTGEDWHCEIKLRVSGYLIESTIGETLLTSRDLKEIQTATAAYLNREMGKTLRHLQRLNSDILALGERMRATHSREWTAMDWEQVYPRMKIKVSVQFHIPRAGTKL
jgi:spore germination protein KC